MNKSGSSFDVWLAQRRKMHDLTQEELAQQMRTRSGFWHDVPEIPKEEALFCFF